VPEDTPASETDINLEVSFAEQAVNQKEFSKERTQKISSNDSLPVCSAHSDGSKRISVLVFRDRVSLYSPGCPGTHFVNQAGLELRNLPASASQVLGLKACTTTPGKNFFFANFVVLKFTTHRKVGGITFPSTAD
jgi:hypothetical protein